MLSMLWCTRCAAASMSRIAANATVAAGVNVVEEHLRKLDGYVVAANQNCHAQTVIAGATDAVERAVAPKIMGSILVKYLSHMRSIPRLLLPLHNR